MYLITVKEKKFKVYREFPGGPVVRTAKGSRSIPGRGTKIPHVAQPKKNNNNTNNN